VVRGGAWNNNSENAACAYRNNNNPQNRNNNIGFRCAKTLLACAGFCGGRRREVCHLGMTNESIGNVQTAGPGPVRDAGRTKKTEPGGGLGFWLAAGRFVVMSVEPSGALRCGG